MSVDRVATPAGSPLPSLTQAQAFSLNKNSTLCLPVFSADNKLLWVHSNSIAQEVAHAADTLDGAFDVFPYPKREEMAKLARRCSLHVDHVRVWFMFQRLHYGISWDYADICAVRRRLLGPGRRRSAKAAVVVGGEDDPQAVREQGEEKEEAEEEEEAAREDVLEEAGERGSSEESGLCVKMGVRGVATEKGEEGRGGGSGETGESTASPTPPPVSSVRRPYGRPRRLLGPGRRRPARATKAAVVVVGEDDPQAVREQGEKKEEEAEKEEEEEEEAAARERPYGRHRKKKKKTPFDLLPKVQVSEIPLASKGHRGPPGAGENHAGRKADSTATVSGDDDGVDGVAPGNGSAHGNTSALGDLGTSKAKASPPDAKPKNKTKTKEQLRRAFLACQYPNPCDYDWLSEWTGLQRTQLIQWFGDTRYDMKNTKPRWITPGDQQRVLARMRQRQRMKHLSTGEAGAGREAASDPGAGTWRLKLEERSAIPIPAPAPAP
ncbi:unnamed protein product [Arctogadus glacialis]